MTPEPASYAASLGAALWQVLGRVAPPREARPLPRWAGTVLTAALVVVALTIVAICITGGFTFGLGRYRISMTGLGNSLRTVLVLGLLRFLVHDSRGKQSALRALRALANARPGLRFAAVLALFLSLRCWIYVCGAYDWGAWARADGDPRTPDVRLDPDHGHLVPLVEWVARGEGGKPVAVVIEDLNPRGHLAAYYCYPRILLMSSEQQRWSFDSRMSIAYRRDPGQAAQAPKPSIASSEAFAESRGVRLGVASPAGVEAPNKEAR